MISLQSLRGKYVLLEFWASWCLPCRGENTTHLTKAFKEYHKKGFAIVSISVDKADAKDKWLNAINSDGLTWFNISDLKGFENAVAKLYHVTEIPQNFLIDPEGKIIAKNLRNGNLEKKLSEIF
jgi:peroxiredoxin